MRYFIAQNDKYRVVLDNNGEDCFYLDLYKRDENDPTEWCDEALDSTWTDVSTDNLPKEVQAIADKVLEGVMRAYENGFEDRQVLFEAKCYAEI